MASEPSTVSTEDLSRNERVMKFLVQSASGRLGRTQLVKLMYLADLEARKYLGRPLSEFRWTRESQGPFDSTFYDVKDLLIEKGLIREVEGVTPYGNPSYKYLDAGGPIDFDFDPAERRVLRYIVKAFSAMSREELVEDVVYETPPFKEVEDSPHGTPVPMDTMDSVQKEKLGGLSLIEIAVGEQQLRSGQGIPLTEAVNALRA